MLCVVVYCRIYNYLIDKLICVLKENLSAQEKNKNVYNTYSNVPRRHHYLIYIQPKPILKNILFPQGH